MMKKMNKKLLGSLILGLMLSAPVSQVNAIQLNGGGIYGTGDSYSADLNIVTDDGRTLTYNFNGASVLNMKTTGFGNEQQNAVFIDGNQKNITINDRLDIFLTNNGSPTGINIFNNPTGKIIDRSKGGNITITKEAPFQNFNAHGAKISNGSGNQILLGDSDISINIDNAPAGGEMSGLYIMAGTNNYIKMGNGSISLTSENNNNISGNAYGAASFDEKNKIEIGDVNINLLLSGGGFTATGVLAHNGAEISTGKSNIDVSVEGSDSDLIAMGASSANGTIKFNDVTNITTTTKGGGDNSTIQSIALASMGNGSISYAGGTITASADNDKATVRAVHVQNDATIDINKGTNNTVVINGDVNNNADGDGKVYLNLNTADSVLNGAVNDAKGTFNLEDGAQWNVLGTSTVNDFRMKNGIIHMDRNYDVNIASYSGNGTISFQAKDVAADGVANFEKVGNVTIKTIKEAEKGASVTLGIANNKIDTLDLEKTEENLNALAKKISYKANDGNLIGKAVIREGLITPEARGDLMFDANDQGYVTNITGGDRTTKTMNAMKNLEAAAAIAWRQEDSTFSQRLGELRESTGGQGIWARMSRGEFEYDGEYKNQYNFFQLGYDWASDNWHYGVAVSHNDGETAYTYGSGENRSTSLSLYGTWLGDAGHYADIVLKQGRLSNDFDVYTRAGHTSGDYDAWGTSLSGEYGKKILLENDWYVTPQAQLTLMRIGGEDYDTNNGIRVRQDTLYSAVGRLGFELGRKLDEKGSVYAKASVLHDFAGNAETYLSHNGCTNSYSQDLSDTWFEAGLGFNYRTGDNSYIYADVVRTFGGDVETPWQWNIGMRWSC